MYRLYLDEPWRSSDYERYESVYVTLLHCITCGEFDPNSGTNLYYLPNISHSYKSYKHMTGQAYPQRHMITESILVFHL